MNDKKSPFGDLCHMHRVSLHLSEAEMGQKIEELGCKLGSKQGSNRQPVISQFERAIDPPGVPRKQHRDPPLNYVETCARLFELNLVQRYELFVAALDSSEKIVIDKAAIDEEMKKIMSCLLAALFVSSKKDVKTLIDDDNNNSLYNKAWIGLKNAPDRFIDEIKKILV
jgi:hypothetical protein